MRRTLVLALACVLAFLAYRALAPSETRDVRRPEPRGYSAVARAWIKDWCRVRPLMTRAQVYAIMGLPTGEFEANVPGHDVRGQAEWVSQARKGARRLVFAAFFRADGRVTQLRAHRAPVPCPATRSEGPG